MQKFHLKIFSYFTFTILLCGTFLQTFSQDVRINEFMALNNTNLADEDGDYSDWLEIYNNAGTSVDLQEWALTDDPADPNKWIFPDITLNAEEYLVVFASGKDRNVPESELHTNFRLNGGGEYLALTNAAGTTITEFSPNFPPQQRDYSYGYFEGTWIEFSDPTPGEDNNLTGGIVIPAPAFNKKHGFYNEPFNLEMQTGVSGADIYYTRDGSEPTAENGDLYVSPLVISSTSVIRAVAIPDGEAPGRIATQSYIFPSDVIHQTNTPSGYPAMWGPYIAISGNAIADYAMDPEMMADSAFAEAVIAGLQEVPTISLVTDKEHFFSHSTDPDIGGIYIHTGAPISGDTYGTGRGWERPVSFEYFDADSASIQVNCGISLHGGHGRRPEKSPKHNLVLKFRSKYGPSRLNYAFFGEEGSGNYNKLIMRAEFCNSWTHWSHDQRTISTYQRDIWTKDTQRDMGHPASNSIHVNLYINGIYWGLYAPSERMDADFGEKYLGGNAEDYDVIKDQTEVADGTWDAWNQMLGMAIGLTSREAYMRIQGKLPDGTPDPANNAMLDVVNLADYMLLNFYGNNTDWDHHNWAAMRNRVDPGSGFKFLSWDAEHMIKDLNGNNLNENNSNCPSYVFTQLKKIEDFRRLFADRIQKHCFNNGALTPEAGTARWMERRNKVEPAIVAESARWGDYRRDVHQYRDGPYELYNYEDHYLPHQDFMLNTYFPGRTAVFLNQLRNAGLYPRVDAPVLYINDNPVFSEIISEGDALSMTATEGTIYYTTNGTDPVSWQLSEDDGIKLIENASDKRVLVPKSNIGNSWYTDNDFDDSGWRFCTGEPGGVGYEKNSGYENLISLDVGNDMHDDGSDPNTSCYVRIAFDLPESDLSNYKSLMLSVNYDDGFAAYLNGIQVAKANAFALITWNSEAQDDHEAGSPENFNITDYLDQLVAGKNVLAIHALNTSTSSSDFLINASLTAWFEAEGVNISADALIYSSPISLEQSSHVIARAFHDGDWSAASDKHFIIPADYSDLKITEIHYNPSQEDTIDGGEFEFIEIKNTGTATLYLGGLEFTNGVDYKFLPETQLGPSEFAVLASNEDCFAMRYDFLPTDEYMGKLDNGGERLVLQDFFMDTIANIRYNDNQEWPQEADGLGRSLVPVDINPVNDQNNPSEWRASCNIGGSPGEDDPTPAVISLIPNNSEYVFTLAQNYPNPFSDITYIDYRLPEESKVQIVVYNVMGQMITTLVNNRHTRGHYQVSWNGHDQAGNSVPNGMYIYMINIQTRNRVDVQSRMMMLFR